MDQHPIPRQITTFEFKLIGFMTLRQFLYLVIFIPLGFIVFKIFPIPIINIFLGLILVLVGFSLAFVPINDRPLEVWIRNFIKRLNSPTQYFFHKNNPPIRIFQNLYFAGDPHLVTTHIDSQEKLAKYMTKSRTINRGDVRKQAIQNIMKNPTVIVKPQSGGQPAGRSAALSFSPPAAEVKEPFFTGTVKNNKKIPLPGILIYVKDTNNQPLRLLKTNPHGVFATYSSLADGEYMFEIKDPKGSYFFDTIKIKIDSSDKKPLELFSKEIL